MPDGDRISQRIRYEWRQAYEGLMAMAEPSVVAPRIGKAIAGMLRSARGLPMLPDAVRLVTAARDGELSPPEAFARAGGLGGSSASGMATARALSRCLVEPPTDVDPRHAVATVILEEWMNASLLGTAPALLAKEGVMTPTEAVAYIGKCRAAALPDLMRLASQAAAAPTAGRYRAPAHRRQTKRMSDLLGESIE